LHYPEYQDLGKAQRVMRYLSGEPRGAAKLPSPPPGDGVKITIGPENLAEELRDSSVVVARYDTGADMQVLVGVVGPTRMDYSKVASRLEYITKALSWLLTAGAESHFRLEEPAQEDIVVPREGADD
jgi:heat-inducible transcriptional repressor